MNYLKRLVSVPEKFYLEIQIHSVTINLPVESELQIVIKRNKNKREKTKLLKLDPKIGIVYFNSTIFFPVTLYKTSAEYGQKTYFVRLIQISKKKMIKNGKAKIDINNYVNGPIEFQDFSLKNCSDSKASVCISLNLSKINQTLSSVSNNSEFNEKEEISPSRVSNSFDETVKVLNSEEKKRRDKEKFLRRIEKFNYHNSPQSALIFQDSDASSCASPLSPNKSPDSPEYNEKFQERAPFFSLKPILIDFDKNDEKKTEKILKEDQVTQEIDENKGKEIEEMPKFDEIESGKVESSEDSSINKIEVIDEKGEESDTSSYSNESNREAREKNNLPISNMSETQPNVNTKENKIANTEIYSETNDASKKCCKCMLF